MVETKAQGPEMKHIQHAQLKNAIPGHGVDTHLSLEFL